jgi:hypothetical protein
MLLSLDDHGVVVDDVPLPLKVTVASTHTVKVPVIVGNAFTVTVSVMLQPLSFVYVMAAVPTATPVTSPVLLTVATDVLPLVQALLVAAVPLPLNAILDPIHTLVVPLIVGNAFTVTV